MRSNFNDKQKPKQSIIFDLTPLKSNKFCLKIDLYKNGNKMKKKKKSKLLQKIDDFIDYCDIEVIKLNDEQFLKARDEIYPFFIDKEANCFDYRDRKIQKLDTFS